MTKFSLSNTTNHLKVTHTFDTHCSFASTNSNFKHVYVAYFNIFMPILFNLTPAILILIINVALCFSLMAKIKNDDSISHEKLRKSSMKSNHSRITASQMSHYCMIITLCVWLILTNIPYYVLIMFDRARLLKITNHVQSINTSFQAISSIFFNSNHCINILIYLMFYKDFRQIIFGMCRRFNKYKRNHSQLNDNRGHFEKIDGDINMMKVYDTK